MSGAVPVLRTLTLNGFIDELRLRGMSIGQERLKVAIFSGLFPFVELFGDGDYIIWRKGFEEWAAEHSVMETPAGFQDMTKTDANV